MSKDLSQLLECLSRKHRALGFNLSLVKEPGGRGRSEADNQQSQIILGYSANVKPIWATFDSLSKIGSK